GARGDALAQGRFQRAQLVRQPHPDLQETVVHRPQLARQGAVGAGALGRCIGGHAADWHRGSGWWLAADRPAKRSAPGLNWPTHASRTGLPRMNDDFQRPSGRTPAQLREVGITRGYTRHAEGSVLVAFGGTRVLCTASVENRVPAFLRGKGEGWVTAEYGMLPRATHTRSDREASRGKQGGRTLEIQRLIGRSLRACIDR